MMQRFRRHIGAVEKVMGGLLVVTGVLFITGGMQTLSFWLLNQFPALQQIG
jgi:cytochrome c-type biogenesis protein